MKWMRERDLLIAQTIEFVQSVTGKKPDIETAAVRPGMPAASEASRPFDLPKPSFAAASLSGIEALLAETPVPPSGPARLAPTARTDVRSEFKSEQSEIKARVAHFRAQQERFSREREAYCSATMAKVHASIQQHTAPTRLGK